MSKTLVVGLLAALSIAIYVPATRRAIWQAQADRERIKPGEELWEALAHGRSWWRAHAKCSDYTGGGVGLENTGDRIITDGRGGKEFGGPWEVVRVRLKSPEGPHRSCTGLTLIYSGSMAKQAAFTVEFEDSRVTAVGPLRIYD